MTNIAICGLGNIGAVHLENLLSLRGCSISGVFDIRPEALEQVCTNRKVKAFASLDALFSDSDTDAVVIATPTPTHRPLTTQALASGKHVFLEKPIAGTIEDANAILELSRNSAQHIQVGFCERFNAHYIEAKRQVESGVLGPIRAIYSSRVAPYTLSDPSWELGIFDTAVHNIDLILWLIGQMPVSVEASGVCLYPDSEIPHSAVTTLHFADGALATDHITWLRDDAHPLHHCARSRMLILGERGSFEIDLSQRPSALLTNASFTMPDTVILGGPGYYGCLKLQFEFFLRSIEEGLPIMAPPKDAVEAERVALAARDSINRRQRICLA